MEKQKSFFEKRAVILTSKILMIGILILFLLIPKNIIQELVLERMYRQQNVVNEVTDKYAKSQSLVGPILKIPFNKKIKVFDEKGKFTGKITEEIHNAYFLPEKLTINGNVQTNKLHRSIYDVIVYTSDIHLEGFFSQNLLNNWQKTKDNILWDKASLLISFSDQKGIGETPTLIWNNKNITCQPGATNIHFVQMVGSIYETEQYYQEKPSYKMTSGMHANINYNPDVNNNFSFDLKLKGSQGLFFTPLGNTTDVNIKSNWHSPSFKGNFLPISETKQISKTGFLAEWRILHFNRNLPQYWESKNMLDISSTQFGVDFKIENNHYQKSERSVKYMILLITLTFLIFFLAETINKLRIHVFQYILVGLAITIFFTLLLALSEHIGFNAAYAVAAVSTIGLTSLYSLSVFKHMKSTLLLLGLSVLIYGFIFVVIQLIEYALLVGAIGLFITIALTMYTTRKINWFES